MLSPSLGKQFPIFPSGLFGEDLDDDDYRRRLAVSGEALWYGTAGPYCIREAKL
jgi:hypothetical protein